MWSSPQRQLLWEVIHLCLSYWKIASEKVAVPLRGHPHTDWLCCRASIDAIWTRQHLLGVTGAGTCFCPLPFFPQCLLQWHNALSQAQTSHTQRSTTTSFCDPLKNSLSNSWDLGLAQISHSIMSIHAQRLSSNTSMHCKCKISNFFGWLPRENLLHCLTFPVLRLYLKPLEMKWLLKPCNSNYLEALKSYPKSKWELRASCSIQE